MGEISEKLLRRGVREILGRNPLDDQERRATEARVLIKVALSNPQPDAWLGPGPGFRGLAVVPSRFSGLSKAVPVSELQKVLGADPSDDRETISIGQQIADAVMGGETTKEQRRALKIAKLEKKQRRLAKRVRKVSGAEAETVHAKLQKVGGRIAKLRKKVAK